MQIPVQHSLGSPHAAPPAKQAPASTGLEAGTHTGSPPCSDWQFWSQQSEALPHCDPNSRHWLVGTVPKHALFLQSPSQQFRFCVQKPVAVMHVGACAGLSWQYAPPDSSRQ